MCCNTKFGPDLLSGKCGPSRGNVKKSKIFKKQIAICQNIIPVPGVSPQHNAGKIFVCRRLISVPPLNVSVPNTISLYLIKQFNSFAVIYLRIFLFYF